MALRTTSEHLIVWTTATLLHVGDSADQLRRAALIGAELIA
jgi:hypothetical protein